VGKYSHVIDKLPRHPGVEPERRDIVQAVKDQILLPALPYAPPNLPEDSPQELLAEAETLIRKARTILTYSAAGRPYAAEFARLYAESRRMRERIDLLGSEIGLLIEASQWVMCEQMEVEGVASLKLTNGQPVSTFLEPYAQVVDKETFRRWCIDEGLERQMSLPWQTTNALTKQRLLGGDPEPPGVTCYAKTKVRLGAE
jgi:hypothetical protein